MQKENNDLRMICGDRLDGSESSKILLHEGRALVSDWSNTESRTVAQFTMVVTLLMPFVLYKYLDYLPQLKNLSKGMKNNQEEVPLKRELPTWWMFASLLIHLQSS